MTRGSLCQGNLKYWDRLHHSAFFFSLVSHRRAWVCSLSTSVSCLPTVCVCVCVCVCSRTLPQQIRDVLSLQFIISFSQHEYFPYWHHSHCCCYWRVVVSVCPIGCYWCCTKCWVLASSLQLNCNTKKHIHLDHSTKLLSYWAFYSPEPVLA